MLFAGPSGFGKSVACRSIAEAMCGAPEALLSVNMQEYQDEQALGKFRGSGPGYRDSGETWTLFSQVRSRPAQVVVLDGLEEVPASLHAPLADVLSGRASDGLGHPTDFAQCLFVIVPGPRLSAALSDKTNRPLARAIGERATALVSAVIEFVPLADAELEEIARRELVRRKGESAPGAGAARDVLDELGAPGEIALTIIAAKKLGGTGRRVIEEIDRRIAARLFSRIATELGLTADQSEGVHADH